METNPASSTTDRGQRAEANGSAPRAAGSAADVEVSVVCPFFNEERILADALTTLLDRLENLEAEWELIVVNDGSTDGSADIARQVAVDRRRLRLVSYARNRGRGYALRQGIAQARGAVIVTTEIDLSWGEDVVERLLSAMQDHPEADVVVASPHLPGGGYKNVPAKRVFFSRFGNRIIRACMSNVATMNTGMTRAYRRGMIQALPLEEDGKEFHLEVIVKAQALKYRIHEIPCVLEWKTYKHEGRNVARTSSSKVNKLVVTHTLFSLFANPIRYVWGLSVVLMLLAVACFGWGVVRLLAGEVSVFVAIITLSLAIISLMFFTFGVLAQQGYMIQRELWMMKHQMLSERRENKEQS